MDSPLPSSLLADALIEPSGLNFRVFESLDAACNWLDLTPEIRARVLISKRSGD